MRIVGSFFSTLPQVAGLFVVADLFPFHLQARKVESRQSISFSEIQTLHFELNIWVLGFVISPFLAPFALGYLVPRAG